MLKIEYLSDHPDLVPLLAEWFLSEWGGSPPQDTLESFEESLLARMNSDKPPLTLVAFKDDEPVGTAALRIQEMNTHPQYQHWLGSVYVKEDWRGRGIGSVLVEAVIKEAKQFKIQDLYLYTRGKESFYVRFGWKAIECPIYRGRTVTIMKRSNQDNNTSTDV
jgi:N-acetylglutamate synthase-like GNAT family acetyltransferase